MASISPAVVFDPDWPAATTRRPTLQFRDLPTGRDEYDGDFCDHLAFALAGQWGTQVFGLYEVLVPGQTPRVPICNDAVHYVAKPPRGGYVDVYGVWAEDDLCEYWREYQLWQSARNAGYVYVLRPVNGPVVVGEPPATLAAVVAHIARAVQA